MEDKKIRVAFLCRDFGIVNRGVETHVLELSKRLKNFNVEVYSKEAADSYSTLLNNNFDLVIPTNGRTQSLKVSLMKIIKGYKTLITGHSGIGRDDVWNIVATFPDIFVALTDKQFEWAKKWAWNTKLKKIPNGVDLKKFTPNGPKLKINLQPPIILSVGALEWYKNHEILIKAVSKLSKGSLMIVGSGSQKNILNKLGQELLGANRFLITEYNYQDMPDVYRSVDIFSLPSWEREAFGIVYLEAMATNKAVIAPNDSVRKEIVGNAGFLVDEYDPQQYTKSLKLGLTKKWGNIPREQAENFSWDRITKEYEKLIYQLVKNK